MEGRAQAMYAIQALKAVVPGFEKAKLRNFGMTLGTRDSRKIIGKLLYRQKNTATLQFGLFSLLSF